MNAARRSPPADHAGTVVIPAGTFRMGSETGRPDEAPSHNVYLDAYEIDLYEVSNLQFRPFVEAGAYADATFWSPAGWQWRTRFHVTQPEYWTDPLWNGDAQPVVGVSWFEAEAFCRFSGKRLPTEAEWERAARGDDARTYPWGNDWDETSTNGPPGGRQTTPIGSYPTGVSPFGVHDMAGNAWEWVADWYDAGYYAGSPSKNPAGPSSGTERGFRGGSWFSSRPATLTTTYREHTNAFMIGIRDQMTGFRCARSVPALRPGLT